MSCRLAWRGAQRSTSRARAALAVAGNALAIVTHNVRDLGRGELAWPRLRILTPAQYLEEQP